MLQSIADMLCYYRVCNEPASVGTTTYNSTIHALHLHASTLKYPRTVQSRAKQHGISHKHCSKGHIDRVLQDRAARHKVQNKKITQLEKENKRLLLNSWKQNATVRPFIEQLLKLFNESKLSQFDLNFLNNWLERK